MEKKKKKKKKRVKEIISEDGVLVGGKGVDFLKKAKIEMHECWQKKFCVEVGWFGGATGAMV